MITPRATILGLGLFALLFSANLPSAANTTTNQTLLNSAYQSILCKTNFTSTYIGYVTSAAPSLSSLNQYSTSLQQQTAQISSLANQGNINSFRTYVAGTYDPELRSTAQNVSARIKAANLSASVISSLLLKYNASKSTYQSCYSNAAENFANQKLALFNTAISQYQNQIVKIQARGVSTSSLTRLLQNAQTEIITPLKNAVQSSNSSQIYSALAEYCLFDGCKNGTNFHLAANFQLQSLTAELNYLESNLNVSSSSFSQTQSYLNSASSLLNTIGTAPYASGQETPVFNYLRNASQSLVSTQVESSALKTIGKEQQNLNSYQGKVNALASNGLDVASLNQLLQEGSQLISQQQNALNSGENGTQLKALFTSNCIDNNCANGTNLHLSLELELGALNASLQSAITKIDASNSLVLNQSGVAMEEGYLGSASSLISMLGTSQYSQAQISQIQSYFANFTANRKFIYTRKPEAANNGGTSATAVTTVRRTTGNESTNTVRSVATTNTIETTRKTTTVEGTTINPNATVTTVERSTTPVTSVPANSASVGVIGNTQK